MIVNHSQSLMEGMLLLTVFLAVIVIVCVPTPEEHKQLISLLKRLLRVLDII